MEIALFLIIIGILAILTGVILFIIALIKKKGWGIIRSLVIFGAGIVLLFVGIIVASLQPGAVSPPEPSAELKIVIESYNISIGDVSVDKLYVDEAEVLLRNEGDASTTDIELAISSNQEKIEGYSSITLEPREEKKVSYSFDWIGEEISKGIGVKEIAVTMRLFGYPERRGFEKIEKQILAEKSITIPIPRVRIGDTIPEVKDKHNLSMTLLSWRESNMAVVGPYSGDEYYTFTAKPGMKFVILIFKFQNNWIRVQQTSYLNAGEIATNKGYIYNMWDSPGIHSEEYKPRKSTDEEVKTLIGDSGGYKDLLPEESIIGCVVFEIPEDEIPIEASIVNVPSLIRYEGELK